ncbi:MAG: sugar phosphate isomerase/epimerase [Synergistaceae bacterium]|jgi:sugar phosphate isomerase/epimerase|nr:sugar phosphate isomerase/epimerase [Synergistaceae bacterium]
MALMNKGESNMKLSCTDAMAPGDTLTQKAELLKKWNYDGIAVFMPYDAWSQEKFDEVSHLEINTGIVPCEFVFSAPCYGHLMDEDDNLRMGARKMYSDAVKICAEIGSVTELEYSYGPQTPLPLFSPYAKMKPEDEKLFLDMFNDLADIAAGSPGYLLLENINRYESPYLNSVKDCLDILEKLNRPSTGILLDLYHMSLEENDLPMSIISAAKWIRHVHLGDSNRLEPGMGHTDWKSCLNALRDIGYDGFLNLECALSDDPERSLPRVAEYIRSMTQ